MFEVVSLCDQVGQVSGADVGKVVDFGGEILNCGLIGEYPELFAQSEEILH